jgi:hypothetical protein
MKKKDYVKPNAQVLSLYTDEFMEGGFHAHSGIKGSLDAGIDGGDADSSNSHGFENDPEP